MKKTKQNVSAGIILLSCLLLGCVNSKNVSTGHDKSSFISVNSRYARYFETGDKKTWVPVMINIIIPDGDEEKVFSTMEGYFRDFSSNGGNAARIWISSPFLEIEDEQIGKYNPVKLQRIDRLLSIADKYGVRIKFTLQHIRTINPDQNRNNSWSNRSFYSVQKGGKFQDMKDFINSPQGKKVYLDRVRVLSKKYKNDPRVFSWELWNEMDAVNAKDWFPFSQEILDSVKAMFPKQLVIQTLGSLHSKDADERYEKMFTLKNNEYISLHRYLDPGHDWGQYDLVREPADLIASTAVRFAYRDNLVTPVVMNEIGAVEENHKGPSKLYPIDSVGVLIHDMVFAPYFSGAAGCGSMWHWNVYVDHQHLWFQYKRFTNATREFDPAEEQFKPFFLERNSMRIYGLKGKKHTIAWCRDTRNNWQTELANGIAPEVRNDFSIGLQEMQTANAKDVRAYDPWKDSWSKLTPQSGRVVVPPFLRSVVIVLDN